MPVHLQTITSRTTLDYTFGEGYEIVHQAQRSGPETIFNNRSGIVYYYATGAATDEFVDEGSFPHAGVNGTEQVNGLTFDYCSGVPDPLGTAITTELRLYEETIACQGVTGWVDANNRNEACGYLLAGLPGDTGMAGLSCWTIVVDLAGGFECTLPQEQTPGSMNNFGWSAIYFDMLNLNLTGPVLNSSGYGTQPWFEYYDLSQPLGAEYLGCWWFSYPISFSMSMEGPPTDTVAYYSANPGTADTVELQGDVEVRAGQAAGWTITNPAAGKSYALIASTGKKDLGVLVGGTAHLLVDWLGNPLLNNPIVMVGGTYAQSLPPALPASIHVQAAEYTGSLTPANITAMSNGLTHSN